MAEKVSDILLTVWLVSDSILNQSQNIKNLLASTGSMDPITIKHQQIIIPPFGTWGILILYISIATYPITRFFYLFYLFIIQFKTRT